MLHQIHWTFPLPSCHEGVLLGNGLMGVLVWGHAHTLRLTIGRADFWDHRGGLPWSAAMTYPAIRKLLESHDEPGLRALFESAPQDPARPTLLPVGRLDLTLPGELASARLSLRSGTAIVELRDGRSLTLELAPRDPVLLLHFGSAKPTAITPLPSGRYATTAFGGDKPAWQDRALPAPEDVNRPELTGFVQSLPKDPALCLGYRVDGEHLYLATDRGPDAPAAVTETATLLSNAIREGPDWFSRDVHDWWHEFWDRSPQLTTPNPTLEHLYCYGMYKLGASTNPRGVACGLQGPWIEDDRLPCWASDYHFNINVQMCYEPAFAGGHAPHLRPLWKMLRAWEPALRENARLFVGIDDGLMLPHAVDDRCTNMGGFWSGTIDHGCTAWVARMMFDAWHRGLEDDAFLASTAYPWLVGALNVYLAMLDTAPDGTPTFPVSVSPEYRGSALNAWGENASFQLAACHSLLDALDVACARLGRIYDPRWTSLRTRLPKACVQKVGNSEQIMLWKDTPLEESHRHHSHLAAICPFQTLDPFDPAWNGIIDATLTHWIVKGMGNWSGWCIPWAAQINARVGNATAAEFLLEFFVRFFSNPGHGVFHNVTSRGISTMGGGAMKNWGWQAMQLDGGQAACAAVMDMLVHDRRGTVILFAGAPASWDNASFDRIRVPGRRLVSATRENGELTRLEVDCLDAGVFTYLHPDTGQTHSLSLPAGQHRIL
jgi:alpha-L-fucosidase 2